jgi:hypothetical protein
VLTRVFAAAPNSAWLVASAVTLVLALRSPDVGALPASESAEALFESGLADMLAGDYETGCPKLEASYLKEPLPGALFTLAECEAAWGKRAKALRRYQAFVNLLPSLPAERRQAFDERRSVALQKIATLGAVVAELTVEVSPEAPPDLVISVDGERLERADYGAKIKRDPGRYAIIAEHQGKIVFQRRIVLVKRERDRVLVPWNASRAKRTEPAAPPGSDDPVQGEGEGENEIPPASYGAGAIGIGGLLVGTIAGAWAMSENGSVDDHCPTLTCNPEGRRALDSARTAAGVSTAGFVAAGVSGVSALVLFLVAPSRSSRPETTRLQPRIVVGDGIGIVLEGRL